MTEAPALLVSREDWFDGELSLLEHTVAGPRSAYLDLLFQGRVRFAKSAIVALQRRWRLSRSKVLSILRLLVNKGLVRVYDDHLEAVLRADAVPSAFWLEGGSWRVLRQRVFERDGFACVYCGKSEGVLHADHVLARVRGGPDELANLVTACAACNLSKGAKLVEVWKA